jgi:ElaB/YqjD/DUF883 family membrane-anchored ribosome-binding protein
MGKDQSQVGTAVDDQQRDPEEIRRDIARTRVELGDTVEALAAKADVKSRSQQKVAEVKRSAAGKKDEVFAKAKHASPAASSGAQTATTKARENPVPVAIAGGLVVGFVAGKLASRR